MAAQCQRFGRSRQVFLVAAHDQQNFAVGRVRVVDHLDHGRRHGREFLKVAHKRRAVVVGGEDD